MTAAQAAERYELPSESPDWPGIPSVTVLAEEDEVLRRWLVSTLARTALPSQREPLIVVVLPPGAAAVSAVRSVRRSRPRARILAITPEEHPDLTRLLEAGAEAIVRRAELDVALVPAVHAVLAGQIVLPRERRITVRRRPLSYREREILTLVAGGLTNAQIAQKLFLAESTVKGHLHTVYGKLGVKGRSAAIALAHGFDADAETGDGCRSLEQLTGQPAM
jgi:DNA-binding NarL/FixJ family response regulator